MNREQLALSIRATYEKRREDALRRAEASRRELLATHPHLAKAAASASEARWQYLRSLTIPGSELTASSELTSTQDVAASALAKAEAELNRIQEALGLSEEQELHFQCPTCQDSGRVGENTCPACYPAVLRESLRLVAPGLLPAEDLNFSRHRPELFSTEPIKLPSGQSSARRQMEQNLGVAEDFIARFPDPSFNLYFTGKPGTGKTFLASAIANRLLDQGHVALLLTMLQWEEITAHYRTLQLTYGVSAEALSRAEDAYQFLIDADLLVIDDFGVSAGLLKEALSEIIMLLHQRKIRGRQTIITSNMSLKDLRRQYDERLLSRILSSLKIIPFMGEDLRLARGTGRSGVGASPSADSEAGSSDERR